MPIITAKQICKTIMRNGYDAYPITISLQDELHKHKREGEIEVAIASAADFETLSKLFPSIEKSPKPDEIALLIDDRGAIFRFYSANITEGFDPSLGLMRITSKIVQDLSKVSPKTYHAVSTSADFLKSDDVFEDIGCGQIKLAGIPLFTLEHNYAFGIRALRMSANYELPIEPNTWAAIVVNAKKIIDYVPAKVFMEEWRLVSAESMWKFIELLQESRILFGMIPELAPLATLKQNINRNSLEEETIFEHTIRCMKHYPEEKLHHDWVGLVATLFHQIGKPLTAQNYQGQWFFFQHHRIGAAITRSVLGRLFFNAEDIEIISSIIGNYVRFQSMMTDAGIHHFMELPQTERIIELNRAIIKATIDANYTNFNHNLKYMERADQPLNTLDPLLNGNEIMKHTGLPPGPKIGVLRDELLNAQILGNVTNQEEAISFVRSYYLKLF